MTSFQETISQVLDKCKSSYSIHASSIQSLRRLHTSNPSRFKKLFITSLKKILALQKSDDENERLIQFFILYLSEKKDLSSNEIETITSFNEFIINYLLDLTEAQCKNVRYKSCRIIRGIIENLSDDEKSEELFECIGAQFIKCVEDKSVMVRKEVFTVLLRILKTYPDANYEIQQCLIDAMKNDLSGEIRALILSNIIVNEETLPVILERSRDIEYNVRKESFKTIAQNLSFEDIPPSYRIYLLKSGLLDMKNVLIQSPEKTRSYFISSIKKFVLSLNNNVANFLALLDIENNEKVIEDVLNLFYKYHKISLDQFNIDFSSPQYFLFWRTYCEFVHRSMPIAQRDQIFENIIPESSELCSLLQLHFDQSNQFMVKQLLKLILIADHDEVGIRKLVSTVSNMVLNCNNIDNCKLMIRVLYKLNSKYSEFVKTVLELATEMKDSQQTKFLEKKWLICLSMCEELLQTMDQSRFLPIISELDENILSPAIQQQDPNIRKLAITCLGLYCSLKKPFAEKYIDLFLKIIQFDNDDVKLISIQVLFDLIMIFGLHTFEKLKNKIKEVLIECLSHEEESIRAICIEGFCKLYLSGEITELDVLPKICFELFNPLTNIEKYRKIHYIVKCFLPIYAQKHPSNMINLKESVIMLFKSIISSRSTPRYILKDIIKYFSGLLDHKTLIDHKNGSEYCINRIGEYLLGEIIKNPYGDQGSYYPELLTMLNWNLNETRESFNRIKSLCENAIKVTKNRASINQLEKALSQIEAMKPFLKDEPKESNSFSKSFEDTFNLSIPANQEEMHMRDQIKNAKRNRLKKKRSEIENSYDLAEDVSKVPMKIKKNNDSEDFTAKKKQLIDDQISKLIELVGDIKNSDEINTMLQQMKNQISNLMNTNTEGKPKSKRNKEVNNISNNLNSKTIQFLKESKKGKSTSPSKATNSKSSKRKRSNIVNGDDDDVVMCESPPRKKEKKREDKIISSKPSVSDKPIYVNLSGFNDNNSNYNTHFRDKLKSMLESMGVKYAIDKMSKKITHTVSPPDSVTMRMLISLIWGQWVVNADWILESYKNKSLVKEDNYGTKLKSNPFLNKKVFITDSFIKENKSRYNKDQFKLLIEKAGKGKIVDNVDENPDYVLVGPRENIQLYKSSQCMRWNQFFSMISPKKNDESK